MADEKSQADLRAEILADFEKKDREMEMANHPFENEAPKDEAANGSSTTSSKEGEQENEPKEGDEPSEDKGNEKPEDHDETGKPDDGKPAADDKGDSKYKKAQRGRERLDEIRRKAEADKEAARKEREAAELAREETRRAIAEARQRAPQNLDPVDDRFSPEEFERAGDYYEQEAEKAVAEGDMDKYAEHVKNARIMRRQAKHIAQKHAQAKAESEYQKFVTEYKTNAEQTLKDHPEIQDPESGVWDAMQKVLETNPILTQHPQGFKYAYEAVKAEKANGKVVELSEQVKQRDAEIARLNALITPEAGNPSGGIPSGDNFDKLPKEKQRELIRKQMERADGH